MTEDWKSHLRRLFRKDAPVTATSESVTSFVVSTAPDAFDTLKNELEPFVHRVEVITTEDRASIVLQPREDADPFTYGVRLRTVRVPNFAFPEINVADDEVRRHRAEVHVNGTRERKNVAGWSEDALIRDVLTTYEERVTWTSA